MIDSILLKIPISPKNYNASLFTRIRKQSTVSSPRLIRYSAEITSRYKREGRYMPQIYIEERGVQMHACIQVSLPKLVNGGTNLFEINDDSKTAVVDALYSCLWEAGIWIEKERILLSRVHRVDFAKIIKLPKGTSATSFIEQLKRSGYRPRTDLTDRDVRSGRDGYWIKFFNSTSSLTIYDKKLEIVKQGYTKQETKLKDLIVTGKMKVGILRYEVALQSPQKINEVLNKITHLKKKAYSFEEIFKEDLSRQVQLSYLNASFNAGLDYLCHYFTGNDVRAHIRNLYGYKRSKIALFFIIEDIRARGQQIVFDEIKMLNGYAARKRIEKEVAELTASLVQAQGKTYNPVAFLQKELEKFKLFTLSS